MRHTRATPTAEQHNAAAEKPSTSRATAQTFPDKRIGAIDDHIHNSPRMLAQRRQLGQALPAAPVQRKNLGQTPLAGGLTLVQEGQRSLVGDGRGANIYYRSADVDGDRTDALVAAAAINGEVGKRVDVWGRTGRVGEREGVDWKQNHMYTPAGTAFNSDLVANLDPYFLYVTIRYGVGEELEQLDLVYQHAPAFTGYVEQIMDSSNDNTKDYPSMFTNGKEVSGTKLDTGNVAKERNLQYSNIHHKDDSDTITAMTEDGTAKGLDAYTKLAGEGARWQAVRSHARVLKDSSRFFIPVPGTEAEPKVYAVDFVSLWLSWDSAFGKQYDISNVDFGNALLTTRGAFKGKGVKSVDAAAITTDDYDLGQ
ncbi:hypothetical protein [Rhizobacter sp. OV335]|uniref:hypothetical protein n=1 Tax=Rhizobacter sp. OV335 TaxID=1500264 RepID=UPI00091AB7B6|nr:hypothetical protein [Rhizobacter sp. OV335]SHN30660.1 hypothetical protein SAMN02787076_04972 [Rhizobacter sp. OV335]